MAMLPPIFAAVVALFSSFSAKPADDANKLLQLFSAGNATEIAGHFSASVQLTTPGKEGVYSKSQAKMILQGFFDAHKPTVVKQMQQGKSENGAHFLVLALQCGTEEYKSTIFYRGNGAKLNIHELKIEK